MGSKMGQIFIVWIDLELLFKKRLAFKFSLDYFLCPIFQSI